MQMKEKHLFLSLLLTALFALAPCKAEEAQIEIKSTTEADRSQAVAAIDGNAAAMDDSDGGFIYETITINSDGEDDGSVEALTELSIPELEEVPKIVGAEAEIEITSNACVEVSEPIPTFPANEIKDNIKRFTRESGWKLRPRQGHIYAVEKTTRYFENDWKYRRERLEIAALKAALEGTPPGLNPESTAYSFESEAAVGK